MRSLAAVFLVALASRAADTEWPINGGPNNIRYSTLSKDSFKDSEMQSNPIVMDGVLYATTPTIHVVALEAATGKELWAFDPNQGKPPGRRFRHRGVTVSKDRVFVTYRNFLYALNRTTGQPIPSFGKEGRIDLREGLDRPVEGVTISASSPGVLFEDMIILGSTVPETLPGSPGHIRAFDQKTGARRWIFHTIPTRASSATTRGRRILTRSMAEPTPGRV